MLMETAGAAAPSSPTASISLVRAVWNDGERLARLSKKPAKEVPLFHGLLRVEAVTVALPPWSAAARSVEAADSPAPGPQVFPCPSRPMP
jgi:hypothetical protein